MRDGPRADALAPATRPAPAHIPSPSTAFLVHRHSVVGTYSSTLGLATSTTYISLLDATIVITIVNEGQSQRAAHRPRPQAVHRHIVPHNQPSSSAPAQRRCYMLRSLYTATCIICIASEERAKIRRVSAGHEACADTLSLSTIDRLLVHRHSVVGTYSSTLCLATCMICIVCEGWATG